MFTKYRIKKTENGFGLVPDINGEFVKASDTEDIDNEFKKKDSQIKELEDSLQEINNTLKSTRNSNVAKIEEVQSSYEDKISILEAQLTEAKTLQKKIKMLELKNEEFNIFKKTFEDFLAFLKELKNKNKNDETKKQRKELALKMLTTFKYLKTGDSKGDIKDLIDDIFIIGFSQNISEIIIEQLFIEIEKKLKQ